MIQLAHSKDCTACGLCISECPKHCIKFEKNSIGDISPHIDINICIGCHKCERACPVLNIPSETEPYKAYAGWSKDEDNRITSASGGIAHELYAYALQNGFAVVGAIIDDDLSVKLKVINDDSLLNAFKNSKYVYSSALQAYHEVANYISESCKVLIIGLPCQIAAFRRLYPQNDNVILVEIICHGVTPNDWLQQHIQYLENIYLEKAETMMFRDPLYKTSTYTFTLYNNEHKCFYKGRANDGDSYQVGFHQAIAYRESCYNCKFAKPKRHGDIILSDFYGLGKKYACDYNMENVSAIVVATHKGEEFINGVHKNGGIFLDERPLDEVMDGNPRYIHPNKKTKQRLRFEKNIKKHNGNFEDAMSPLVQQYIKRLNEPKYIVRLRAMGNRIKNILKII